jgi:predicted DNA binding CopG/RHH family protein
MEDTKKAMVSRSLRLRTETLEVLKEQADIQGLGITVYIRRVLESLVENIQQEELPVETESLYTEEV